MLSGSTVTGHAVLRVPWREQHPRGHEQRALNFIRVALALKKMRLSHGKDRDT